MPGFLIPSDLERLLPAAGWLQWAEDNLLASPGALVMQGGKMFRIHTLVPAVKRDGTCINLSADGRCSIHANAPFGCAFFDCGPERGKLSHRGLLEVLRVWVAYYYEHIDSRYTGIWEHLDRLGKRQKSPDELRAKMARATGNRQ